jgi:hypothetical protein
LEEGSKLDPFNLHNHKIDKPKFVSSFSGMIFWLSGLAKVISYSCQFEYVDESIEHYDGLSGRPCNGSVQIQIQIQARWFGVLRLILFDFKNVAI